MWSVQMVSRPEHAVASSGTARAFGSARVMVSLEASKPGSAVAVPLACPLVPLVPLVCPLACPLVVLPLVRAGCFAICCSMAVEVRSSALRFCGTVADVCVMTGEEGKMVNHGLNGLQVLDVQGNSASDKGRSVRVRKQDDRGVMSRTPNGGVTGQTKPFMSSLEKLEG
ncbi:hypothetical protein VTI28DRAFT_6810 [Corynascus sepedonium]